MINKWLDRERLKEHISGCNFEMANPPPGKLRVENITVNSTSTKTAFVTAKGTISVF